MTLTKNFTLEEMTFSPTADNRNIPNIPDECQVSNLESLCKLILQPIRDRWRAPIIVTSGFRSETINRLVGGSPNSQHVYGEAADIISYDNRRLFNLITVMIENGEIDVGQLIDEKNYRWIHISLPTLRHHNRILHIS